jgi:uncharacterized C2H2 Zn-finger protein
MDTLYKCDRCGKECKTIKLLLRHLNKRSVCKVAENGCDISQEDLIDKYNELLKYL